MATPFLIQPHPLKPQWPIDPPWRNGLLCALGPIAAEAFKPLQYGTHRHAGVDGSDEVDGGTECFLRDAGVERFLGAPAGAVGAAAGDGNSQADEMFLTVSEVFGGVCLFQGLDNVQFLRVHARTLRLPPSLLKD